MEIIQAIILGILQGIGHDEQAELGMTGQQALAKGIGARGLVHSGVTPALRWISVQRGMSAWICAAISSGVLPASSTPLGL